MKTLAILKWSIRFRTLRSIHVCYLLRKRLSNGNTQCFSFYGNAGNIIDHRWRYTDSSGLFKEKVWILENKTFELEN
jgi:hypothetical protein